MSKPSQLPESCTPKTLALGVAAPNPGPAIIEALPLEYFEVLALYAAEWACPQCGGIGWCNSGCPTL